MNEVALITLSCVLFVQMGLADAILRALRVKKVSPCPKCLTFWSVGLWMGLHGYNVVLLVATSFIASYCALWLALTYDALAKIYNQLYEQLTEEPDAAKVSKARGKAKAGSTDAVSKM